MLNIGGYGNMPNFNEIAALQYAKFCLATSSGRSLPFDELPEMVKGAWVSVVAEVWENGSRRYQGAIKEREKLTTRPVEALVGSNRPPRCRTCQDTGCVTTVTQYFGRGELGADRVIRRTAPCPHCDIAVGVFLTKRELSNCLQFALKASLDTPSCGWGESSWEKSSLVEKLEKALDSFK